MSYWLFKCIKRYDSLILLLYSFHMIVTVCVIGFHTARHPHKEAWMFDTSERFRGTCLAGLGRLLGYGYGHVSDMFDWFLCCFLATLIYIYIYIYTRRKGGLKPPLARSLGALILNT